MRLSATILVLVALVAIASASSTEVTTEGIFSAAEIGSMFKKFLTKFKLSFSVKAMTQKLANFKANVEKITAFNSKKKGGFKCEVNRFTAHSAAQLKKLRGARRSKAKKAAAMIEHENAAEAATPEETAAFNAWTPIDWRSKGVLGPIRSQEDCGSCYAFAAVATVESAIAIKYKTSPPRLSEQYAVDCSTESYGCDGGWYTDVYGLYKRSGIVDNAAYGPYKAVQGSCRGAAVKKSQYKVLSWDSQGGSDLAIYRQLMKGPVGIAYDADDSQMFYSSGIITGESCTTEYNHAAVVVGAGKAADGTKFWWVRNSWGDDWGQAGYFQLRTGNTCGVHEAAERPIIA